MVTCFLCSKGLKKKASFVSKAETQTQEFTPEGNKKPFSNYHAIGHAFMIYTLFGSLAFNLTENGKEITDQILSDYEQKDKVGTTYLRDFL